MIPGYDRCVRGAWLKKRTVVLLRPYAGAGSVLLSLSLFLLAGCSGSSSSGDGGEQVAGRFRLNKSEIIALKKANKNKPKDFKNALLKQKLQSCKRMVSS